MSITHAMEQLAIAVLRGDEAAARALADLVGESTALPGAYVPPLKSFALNSGALRVVLFTHPSLGGDVRVDVEHLREAYDEWLRGEAPLMLSGMQADLYLLPERALTPTPATLRVLHLDAPPTAEFLAGCNGRPMRGLNGTVIGRTANARWEAPYVVCDVEETI